MTETILAGETRRASWTIGIGSMVFGTREGNGMDRYAVNLEQITQRAARSVANTVSLFGIETREDACKAAASACKISAGSDVVDLVADYVWGRRLNLTD